MCLRIPNYHNSWHTGQESETYTHETFYSLWQSQYTTLRACCLEGQLRHHWYQQGIVSVALLESTLRVSVCFFFFNFNAPSVTHPLQKHPPTPACFKVCIDVDKITSDYLNNISCTLLGVILT